MIQPQTEIQKKQVDYYAIAKKYAKDVTSGKIMSSEWTKKSCQRFLDDLENKIWKFDKDKVGRCCRFVELCPHIKGSKALSRLKLSPWQVFIVANIVGFVDKTTGHRRFTRAIVSVARGNGKSFLMSAIGLFFAFFDGEQGADVFSLATSKDQAKLVWSTSQAMVRAMPDLMKKVGVDAGQNSITQEKTNSTFRPLAADYGNLDGLNPYVVVIDELHAVTRGLYDVVETAMSKREQPLMISITTAGSDTSTVGYELTSYGKQVLGGLQDDDRFFFLLYEAESEDVLDKDEWTKANPNLNVSVSEQSLSDMAKKASTLSSFRHAFITRHLNRWVNSREAWLNLQKWDDCKKEMKLEDFEGRECFIGLDLSTRNDVTSKCYVFPDFGSDGKRTYHVFWKNYLPEVAIQESRNASYSGWALDQHITTIEGDTIDFNQIQEEILEDQKRFNVQACCFDPWNAAQLAQGLAAEGVVMVEVRPTVKQFSPPMKEMEAAVLDKRLFHDGNPAVRWMCGNITVKPDAAGNVYPSKTTGNNKIDAGVALISALSQAMMANIGGEKLYATW